MKKYSEVEFEVIYAGEINTAITSSNIFDDSQDEEYYEPVKPW